MANKAAIGGLAAVVVVIAVVGTIAAVTSSKHGSATLSASTKLSTFCSSTLYPVRCERSLATVLNDTASPEDIVRAAVQVALDELYEAFHSSADIGKGANDSITQGAMSGCKKLLNDATDDLKDMASIKPEDVAMHTDDLRTWLSSVMTYIYTCADGFDKPELKEAMDKVLQNSTELSSNALAIVTQVAAVVKEAVRVSNMETGTSRKLLGWQFGETAEQESRRRLLAIDQINEIAEVADASQRVLSETLDEVSEMSHDASRRLLGLLFDRFGNATEESDAVRRRLLSMMANDVSNTTEEGGHRRLLGLMIQSVNNATEIADSVRRRLLGIMINAAPDDTKAPGRSRNLGMMINAESDDTKEAGHSRHLGMMLNDASNMADEVKNKRTLLSFTFNDVLNTTEEDGRRRLLSMQLQRIANISEDINHRLRSMGLPDDFTGRRRLLSMMLMKLNDVTTEAKGRLQEMNNTFSGKPHERVLTTNVIGTREDIVEPHRTLSDSFPEWVSSHDRRLLQAEAPVKPNVVVAKDGSGNFKTITEAVNSAPKGSQSSFVIYVKAGVYNEYVTVPKDKVNIFMYGDGSDQTRVVGNRSNKGGFATVDTRTFSAEGKGFICKSMGFSNTAGPEGHQAVALHVQGDMSVFYNCRFDGYQDTLYVHANRQFFRDCIISGTVDFIFGNSAAVFQNCLIIARKPMESQGNMVTAQGRTDPNMPTGIVIQNCRIVPEDALFPARFQIPSYLGRPWKQYSRTVVMETVINDFIKPEGWMPWDGDFALKTLYYAEYANTGPGAGTSKRVKWPGYRVIGKNEATQFTAGPFIDGNTWIKFSGAPNILGFTK